MKRDRKKWPCLPLFTLVLGPGLVFGSQGLVVKRIAGGRLRGDHLHARSECPARMRAGGSWLYGSGQRLLSGRVEFQGGRPGRRILKRGLHADPLGLHRGRTTSVVIV
jgi:hypothetical protein